MDVLLGILFGVGIVVATGAAVIAYREADYRDVTYAGRVLRGTVLGGVTFGGVLLPYAFENQLEYLYLGLLKPQPVIVSPYEWVMVTMTAGILVSASILSLYLAASRYARANDQ